MSKTGLPSNPTPSQKAAEAVALGPAEQAARWKTYSGASPRLEETHARLGGMIRKRFPEAQEIFEYNLRGWKIRRPVEVTEWKGTIDPNWIRIYVAQRKQGMTIHVWNPSDPEALKKHKELAAVGFKTMVGCLQYNRKGDVPLDALEPLLEGMRRAWDAEAGGGDGRRAPQGA